MGRKLHYRPGSHYKVDDRTGFPERAESTQREWDNAYVSDRVWEPRQPQDFVRGVRDDQSVPDPRPISPDVDAGPIYCALAAPAAVGARNLALQSTVGLSVGDRVGVMLDSGVLFLSALAPGWPLLDLLSGPLLDLLGGPLYDSERGVTGIGVVLLDPLPYTAGIGNLMIDYATKIPAVP